jgi:hypothetical protein
MAARATTTKHNCRPHTHQEATMAVAMVEDILGIKINYYILFKHSKNTYPMS